MSRAKNAFYTTNEIPKPRPGTVQSSSKKDMTTNQMIEEFQKVSNAHNRNTTSNLTNVEKKQHFKRDTAKFYGNSYKSSEMGSIFQDNTAEFYGVEKPPHGEIIVDPNTKPPMSKPKKTSVLNERRLKNHEMNAQRHPMYGKNLKRFYGMKSTGSASSRQFRSSVASSSKGSRAKGTYAEQLTSLIG